MIRLTRLNRTEVVVNAELINIIEAAPDTVVSLTSGEKLLVKESVDEVIKQVIDYKHRIISGDQLRGDLRIVDRSSGEAKS